MGWMGKLVYLGEQPIICRQNTTDNDQKEKQRTCIRVNNNILYGAQQQLYELLALYRSTNALEHTSVCYLNLA